MVRIKTLVENTSVSSEYGHKHGVSFYIETSSHKILFDVGPNDLFLENAKKMDVDISKVDTVIISHGHMDHAGALGLFLKENNHAKVYIKKEAFEKHYTKVLALKVNISLDKKLQNHPQLIFTDDVFKIDDELLLFSKKQEKSWGSKANTALLAEINGRIVQDDFSHEQSLIIFDEQKRILVSGCSHSGIVSIKDKAETIIGEKVTHVIGGFHLYNPTSRQYESDELITSVAKSLDDSQTCYYTCHCTGIKAFEKMKKVLGSSLNYTAAGNEIRLA